MTPLIEVLEYTDFAIFSAAQAQWGSWD